MRYIFLVLLLSISTIQAFAQTKETKAAPAEEGFEMKQYYFVMLTKGERRHEITDTAVISELQRGHLSNINRLAELGKIVVAGPFGDNGNWRGVFIFDCPTEEEVRTLLNSDPAIKAGRLAYEIHPWWTAKNCVFK
jgi:uncharacterized protein YciI